MNCFEIIEFLMNYLDGELPDDERREFEVHLGECPECVAYLENYRQAVDLSKQACAGDCSDIPEELVQAILKARKTQS